MDFDKIEYSIEGKKLTLIKTDEKAPLLVLNTVRNEGLEIVERTKELYSKPFSILTIENLNWDDDLTPWYCPPLNANDEPCNGKADEYIKLLEEKIIPETLNKLSQKPEYIAICGYSLAGLFALYSIYKTTVFDRVVSASGSFWYPDFVQFTKAHQPLIKPEKLYFSLGNLEARTNNRMLQPVWDNTQILVKEYQQMGIDTIFVENQGNHFYRPVRRMADGLAWIMEPVNKKAEK